MYIRILAEKFRDCLTMREKREAFTFCVLMYPQSPNDTISRPVGAIIATPPVHIRL